MIIKFAGAEYIRGMNIGIIGLGDMGKLYARAFAKAGYSVSGSDLPENRAKLEEELEPLGIKIIERGSDVARSSDLIIYSVEAERLQEVVAAYGPSTKFGAIVAGQTSVKHPEIAVFEKYLPTDSQIITFHARAGFRPKRSKTDPDPPSLRPRCLQTHA